MCGIVGIVGQNPVNHRLYEALTMLQHRGQDAAGIVTSSAGRLYLRKANGLARDVFRESDMRRLSGNLGIGQVRYPTAGTDSSAEAQPLYVNSPYGITLAHNGNLTNAKELTDELFKTDFRHLNTSSDSEVLLNVFAHEMATRARSSLAPDDIFDAVGRVHERCRGAYAVTALIVGHGLVAFRDPHGIRPLVIGVRDTDEGKEYMVASESVALDTLGFTRLRDVGPGETLYITEQGKYYSRPYTKPSTLAPCIFEYVYLARPDSILDEISVYKSRLRAGECLVDRVLERFGGNTHDIDVVIPVPDTSRTAALPLAYQLNVKYREGFIKNRYIGRTFIMPDQRQRKYSVRRKLNAIELEFRGKNVLLVDDSIVRGTTSQQIVQMARSAGARHVYLASASPPVRYPNIYGIDMPSTEELIASNKTEEEIAHLIGADMVIYQRLEDLIRCSREGNPSIQQFECSIFNGKYLEDTICDTTLKQHAKDRNRIREQHKANSARG